MNPYAPSITQIPLRKRLRYGLFDAYRLDAWRRLGMWLLVEAVLFWALGYVAMGWVVWVGRIWAAAHIYGAFAKPLPDLELEDEIVQADFAEPEPPPILR